jgi:hypothetical protein
VRDSLDELERGGCVCHAANRMLSSERISVACTVSGLNNLRRLRAFPASLRTGGAGVTPPRDIGEMRRPDATPAGANYSMLSSSSIITR